MILTKQLRSFKYCTLKLRTQEQEIEDTKGVIRIRIQKKNRQHNGQKKKYKRTNNDLQNIHIILKNLQLGFRLRKKSKQQTTTITFRTHLLQNTSVLLCNSLRWLFRPKLLRTQLDIYVIITITDAIHLLEDYASLRVSPSQQSVFRH